MSESAGAAAGGSAGSAAATGTSSNSGTSVTPGSSTSESSTQNPGSQSGNKPSTAAQQAKPQEAGADDFEEVAIGSVKGRVPKAMAAAMKNLERGFHTKSQELAAKEKMLSLGKQNPREFFKQTGMDIDSFAEEVLAEKYENMAMDPRDRELKQMKAAEADRVAKENASKQEVLDALKEFGPLPKGAENASREELIQYYRHQRQVQASTQKSLDDDMGNAFKESGLIPDKHLLAKVAFEMRSALARNKSLSAKDAVAKVKSEYYSGAKQTFGKMSPKQIHEIFGDEFLEGIRSYSLEQATANAASRFGQQNNSPGSIPASDGTKKYLNQSEWRKAMGIS